MDAKELNHHFASHAHPAPLSDYDRAALKQLAEIHGTPLLVLNLAAVDRQYRALAAALPGVKLFYAVKALAHPALLARLNQLGGCFDLATAGEVNMVRDLGIAAERCIHTHPIKKDSEIREALDFGCTRFVVDNLAEVDKFLPYRQTVELIVRVSYRSQDAVVDLSRKFGCALEELDALLAHVDKQGLTVKGLSFHVGSQSTSPA
ncbi:MAG TPA: type III PLP-dependent enzyme, partial [Piscirickettsiaceae bacterium]|nr:type III PLP-dependent enzyme [Piscirickettsiaceae bacterium]